VTDITEGRGRREQIDLLKDLADTISVASLCALGKTAPNPVLSTLRYFPEEYIAHVDHKKCPAGVCKALIRYSIETDKCNGCGSCLRACPHGAIYSGKKKVHVIDDKECQKCGICVAECKFAAITVN